MINYTPAQLAEAAVNALEDKKGKDIKLLRTGELTVIADYFVLCTANSTTHIKTLSDEVDSVLSKMGEPPLRREGYRAGGWVLLDFGCIVVHIFLQETRAFYNLERLWSDAEVILPSSLPGPC
ncbi:MAG TPA: ribosome silencing factor [Clostridiales bacterium]|nr:ribosome silencing factor [Clostridiales bacterium]